ncbi:hypothetical protein L1049_001227 [Liquidambar formosana]|uniref:SAM domain-containing protein n=1 Tax=Liquidambar formosana TaxID=63359 RepID=A0AAP0NB51_LIQFO
MDWFSWLSKTNLDPSLTYEYGLAFARNELKEEDITYFNHEFLQSMGISIAKHRLEILKLSRKEIRGWPRALSRLVLAINKTKRCLTKCVASSKWDFHDDPAATAADRGGIPNSTPYRGQRWGPMLRKHKSSTGYKEENFRSPKLSGPLDPWVQERPMVTYMRPKVVSGPLDGKVHERLMFTNRSPRVVSGPLDRKGQEMLMLTGMSPVVSGPLDGRVQEKYVVPTRSPRVSGPLDGRVASPMAYGLYENEKMDDDYGDQSLWAALFQDMKPT